MLKVIFHGMVELKSKKLHRFFVYKEEKYGRIDPRRQTLVL
jgi:hypothetical protein